MRTAFINQDGEGIVVSAHNDGLDILIYLDPRKTNGKMTEEISLTKAESFCLLTALREELLGDR